MKRVLLLGLLVLAPPFLAPSQTKAQKTTYEQQVRKAEAERVKALLNQDWATLDRIYGDDYLAFDSRGGEVRDKSRVIADLKSGNRKIVSVDDQDVVVRVYGTVAVITGLSRSKVLTRGREDTGPGRYIQVYVKRQGRWQIVAHQYSPIASPAAQRGAAGDGQKQAAPERPGR